MAVSTEIELKEILGLDSEVKELMESTKWDVSDVALAYAYEDGKRTGTVSGVKWALLGPRRGDRRLRNKSFTVTSSELLDQTVLDAILDAGATVKLKNIRIGSLWADSPQGSTFAAIHCTWLAEVEVLAEEEALEN